MASERLIEEAAGDEFAATLAAAREHLRRLFDGLEGFVALGVGFGGFINAKGSYEFKSFAEDFYAWPGQAEQLVAPVRFLDIERGPRDWTISQLDELLVSVPTPSAPVEPVMPAVLPPRVAARLAESPQGDRSAQSFGFLALCAGEGLTDAHTLALALRHPPTVEKYGARTTEEVARVLGKIRAETPEREPFALEVVSARDFCARPDPPTVDELLGALVRRGQRIVVGAHTGEGKTTLALAIIEAVVTGDDLLGFQGVGGVRALVLDAEQGVRTIKRRLHEAGLAECVELDVIRVPDGLNLDSDPQHVAEVERVLAAGDYALVVCDPLYKLHGGESNAEREAVDLMRRFDAWRERYSFGLLLPVHCRKPVPGLKFSIHDLFGSSAYVRGAEIVLGLQRVSDGYSRLHFLKDRDGDLPIAAAWGLLFSRDEGYRRDPNDGKVRDIRAELLEALGHGEWRTLDELRRKKDAGGIGADPNTVRPELDALTSVGLLEYRIGPPGRHHSAKCWRVSSARYDTDDTHDTSGLSGDREEAGVVVSSPYIGDTQHDTRHRHRDCERSGVVNPHDTSDESAS